MVVVILTIINDNDPETIPEIHLKTITIKKTVVKIISIFMTGTHHKTIPNEVISSLINSIKRIAVNTKTIKKF
jgi:hypothetical protein